MASLLFLAPSMVISSTSGPSGAANADATLHSSVCRNRDALLVTLASRTDVFSGSEDDSCAKVWISKPLLRHPGAPLSPLPLLYCHPPLPQAEDTSFPLCLHLLCVLSDLLKSGRQLTIIVFFPRSCSLQFGKKSFQPQLHWLGESNFQEVYFSPVKPYKTHFQPRP